MRILGYILVIAGFLFILGESTVSLGKRRALWLSRTSKVLTENDISPDAPVAQHIFEMSRFWSGILQGLAVPAVMMIVGAVFLDQARRNGNRKPGEPQQPPERDK